MSYHAPTPIKLTHFINRQNVVKKRLETPWRPPAVPNFQRKYDLVGTADGESGLVGEGIVIRVGRYPVRTPVGARPGLGTQPRYETLGDPRVDYVKRK